jgi:formate hydrogenlyase subunit 6/NADH:ubiquinone oxidoreductase subunit I
LLFENEVFWMKHPGRIFPEVFSSIFKKPATVKYPTVKVDMPENYRGRITFDSKLCIGCKICMRDCPAKAVLIEPTETEKVFKATFFLDHCIFCAQCADSCPRKALHPSKTFELAHYNRASLEDRQK